MSQKIPQCWENRMVVTPASHSRWWASCTHTSRVSSHAEGLQKDQTTHLRFFNLSRSLTAAWQLFWQDVGQLFQHPHNSSTFTASFHLNTNHWCHFSSDDLAFYQERVPTTFHIAASMTGSHHTLTNPRTYLIFHSLYASLPEARHGTAWKQDQVHRATVSQHYKTGW